MIRERETDKVETKRRALSITNSRPSYRHPPLLLAQKKSNQREKQTVAASCRSLSGPHLSEYRHTVPPHLPENGSEVAPTPPHCLLLPSLSLSLSIRQIDLKGEHRDEAGTDSLNSTAERARSLS